MACVHLAQTVGFFSTPLSATAPSVDDTDELLLLFDLFGGPLETFVSGNSVLITIPSQDVFDVFIVVSSLV